MTTDRDSTATTNPTAPRVGLMVTCLVDFFRPSIGFATVKLLEQAGCRVAVPEAQTCCGQPAYNAGDAETARALAQQVVAAFEDFDYVVVPSGSCAGMVRLHLPKLLADTPAWSARAEALAAKTHELVSFLTDVMQCDRVAAAFDGAVTYHDSCAGLRELSVKQQPRTLLGSVDGLTLTEMSDPEACCGFGGTFCVKYPDVSGSIATKKLADAEASGAGMLIAGDLGCLLHLAGKARRDGRALDLRHVAEVLAGATETPPIGGPREPE